jgi:hypothetical protein
MKHDPDPQRNKIEWLFKFDSDAPVEMHDDAQGFATRGAATCKCGATWRFDVRRLLAAAWCAWSSSVPNPDPWMARVAEGALWLGRTDFGITGFRPGIDALGLWAHQFYTPVDPPTPTALDSGAVELGEEPDEHPGT